MKQLSLHPEIIYFWEKKNPLVLLIKTRKLNNNFYFLSFLNLEQKHMDKTNHKTNQ